MKKILLYTFSIFLIYSCSSDYEPPHETVPFGGFVRYDEAPTYTIDISDPNSSFTVGLVAPGGNVATYDVSFSFVSLANDTTIGPFTMKTISSFPSSLNITPAEVATAAGIDLSEIQAGDKISVDAIVTTTDGKTFTSADFTGDLFNPGQRQAMSYDVFFLCPFVRADAIGEYLIVTDDFVTSLDYDTPIQAIAGPGENEITFVNLFMHPEMYDVTVNVTDPANAIAEVVRQPAWHCDNFGCGFGEGRVDGGGLYFSCAGFLTLDLTHTVDAGSFGTFKLELQKQ